jgi:tetratricopeptide (TPR) repeat protein
MQPQLGLTQPRGVLHMLKRYWYVWMIMLVAVGILGLIEHRFVTRENAWKQAAVYYSQADYSKAAAELEDMPVPTSSKYLRVYSQAMLATGQLDKALAGYIRLHSITKDPATKLTIGNIYNKQQDTQAAADAYKAVIVLDSHNSQAYQNLAAVYKSVGMVDKAREIAAQGVQASKE